jgi:hypothetical protein
VVKSPTLSAQDTALGNIINHSVNKFKQLAVHAGTVITSESTPYYRVTIRPRDPGGAEADDRLNLPFKMPAFLSSSLNSVLGTINKIRRNIPVRARIMVAFPDLFGTHDEVGTDQMTKFGVFRRSVWIFDKGTPKFLTGTIQDLINQGLDEGDALIIYKYYQYWDGDSWRYSLTTDDTTNFPIDTSLGEDELEEAFYEFEMGGINDRGLPNDVVISEGTPVVNNVMFQCFINKYQSILDRYDGRLPECATFARELMSFLSNMKFPRWWRERDRMDYRVDVVRDMDLDDAAVLSSAQIDLIREEALRGLPLE